MAIHIIEGVPGAGKTYYAVQHLLANYFSKDADGNYQAKSQVKIITNVDGLSLDHERLKDVIEASGGAKRFFSKDFQAKVFEKHGPVIYMIDEAQMIFDRKFYDREVFSWFEYHRHFGQTIYLITQAAGKLPRDVTCLVETIIRALPRSRSITGLEFRYNLVSGSHTKLSVVKIDKKIFEIYKSAGAGEVEKVKNPFMKRIAVVAVLAVLFFYFGWKYVFDTWGHKGTSEARASVPPATINQPVTTTPRPASFNQQPAEKRKETLIPHKLNYMAVSAGINSYVKIAFAGRVYTLKDFPFKVEIQAGELIAMIPPADYEFYFPDGKPERKYYTPETAPQTQLPERLERRELGQTAQP
ncbi:MAG: hypothetical protein HY885_07615 [Deltaproteobacteria bacterium]|nr:hypothetical protein [Deltaproteobacteria bacterium]